MPIDFIPPLVMDHLTDPSTMFSIPTLLEVASTLAPGAMLRLVLGEAFSGTPIHTHLISFLGEVRPILLEFRFT